MGKEKGPVVKNVKSRILKLYQRNCGEYCSLGWGIDRITGMSFPSLLIPMIWRKPTLKGMEEVQFFIGQK